MIRFKSTVAQRSLIAFFLSLLLCGCASEKTGCPSGKTWYQQGKSAKETKRDLAICQNEALAYGRSYSTAQADSAGRAIVLGWINSGFESSRENKIVKTCMVAKGYYLVDQSSPLLSNAQAKETIRQQSKSTNWNVADATRDAFESALVGHWISTNLLAGKTGKLEFSFLAEHHYKISIQEKGSITERYYISGNKLVTWGDKDKEPESSEFIVDDIHLMLRIGGKQFLFQKIENINETDVKAAENLIGHWKSVAFKGKAIGDGVEKMEFAFFKNNRCECTTIQKGKTYITKGEYKVKGEKLIIGDKASQADAVKYSLIGDHLVIEYPAQDAEIIFQKIQTASP